jgi:hypothetical protein
VLPHLYGETDRIQRNAPTCKRPCTESRPPSRAGRAVCSNPICSITSRLANFVTVLRRNVFKRRRGVRRPQLTASSGTSETSSAISSAAAHDAHALQRRRHAHQNRQT